MGKPYKKELAQFCSVIKWAKEQDVNNLKAFFELLDCPIYCIGSGGSLTAASLCSQALENIGINSKFITAFDLLSMPEPLNKTNYILFTASGENNDSIAVVQKLQKFTNNKSSIVLTQNPRSTIRKYSNHNIQHVSYDIPTKKDGFLATNTLLSTCVIMCKLFNSLDLYNLDLKNINYVDNPLDINLLKDKKHVLAIYGKWGLPAAIDLESKLVESGIISVQLTNYRNFAHGRHNWINKNFDDTLVVFLETDEDKNLTNEILNLLPNNLSYIKFSESEDSPISSLNLILKVMNIVYYFGLSKNIDPGQPGIPDYGSKIYNMNVVDFYDTPLNVNILTRKNLAILKKSKYKHFNLIPQDIKEELTSAYDAFYIKLTSTKYKAIIFDYDATLLSRYERFDSIDLKIKALLEKILKTGIKLAIVTGRGKSVYSDISNSIIEKFHDQIYIGYYNGAIIKKLSEGVPNKNSKSDKNIIKLNKILHQDTFLNKIAEIDDNNIQTSIILKELKYKNHLISILKEIIFNKKIKNIKVLTSSHSIDIIPEYISKTDIYDFLNHKFNLKNKILSIGDSGQWPGNDFELLSNSNSLSVDSVSSLQETCWNIEFNYRDTIKSTEKYLKNLKLKNNYVQFKKNKDYE